MAHGKLTTLTCARRWSHTWERVTGAMAMAVSLVVLAGRAAGKGNVLEGAWKALGRQRGSICAGESASAAPRRMLQPATDPFLLD